MSKRRYRAFLLAGGLAVFALPEAAPAQQAMQETFKSMLATQIRAQGFECTKALKATQDTKRSRPDYGVWVLTCSNATYRVSRAPDMAAKVQRLR